MSAGGSDPRISWSGSLGAGLGGELEQVSEELKNIDAQIKNTKSSVRQLDKYYNAVYGKHANAEGALEINQKIVEGHKQEMRLLKEKEAYIAKIKRLRSEAGKPVPQQSRQGPLQSGKTIDRQFGQFKKGQRILKFGSKLSALAFSGTFAFGERDLSTLAFGLEYAGQALGGSGGALSKLAPWVSRAAGPLMFAAFGGELAKAAISSYYQPKMEASKAAGDVGAMLGTMASDPSTRMEDLQGLINTLQGSYGSSADKQASTRSLVAAQAQAIMKGGKPLSASDVSYEEAARTVIHGTVQERAGKSMWGKFWDMGTLGLKSIWGGHIDEIDKMRERLAISKMEERQKADKVFKEFSKEQLSTPEMRIKKFKEDLRLSAYELTRSKQRMLAPTI